MGTKYSLVILYSKMHLILLLITPILKLSEGVGKVFILEINLMKLSLIQVIYQVEIFKTN